MTSVQANRNVVEIQVSGMDCAECISHVQRALEDVPGVLEADVFLTSEKAVLHVAEQDVNMESVSQALKSAGYGLTDISEKEVVLEPQSQISRQVGLIMASIFVAILLIVIFGELLGLFEILTESIPFTVGLILVIVAGWPIFYNVGRVLLQGRIISHTLMTVGVIAALVAGQWLTALLVVFFMRVGDYIERLTTDKARYAIRRLLSMAPQTARLIRQGKESVVPIQQVVPGDIVLVRPGDKIAVDGIVIDGQATIDQSAITGESMPIEAGPGTNVYAATIALLGSLQVETTQVGADSTYGRIVKLVEEAESNRAEVQRFADKFSAYFLPLVGSLAALTLILRRDPMATVAVLVVACSCAIALATPIAVLASIGAGAKKGLLIKGGKYLEALDKADIMLVDKTGTLTLGRPHITDVISLSGLDEEELLTLTASAERYSEHPIAESLRVAARERGYILETPSHFESVPGLGIRATVGQYELSVGSRRLSQIETPAAVNELEEKGKTVLYITDGSNILGLIALSDTLRSDVKEALSNVSQYGIEKIELLTGDNAKSAAELADQLNIPYRANLMPEDKIEVVKQYQKDGHVVIMIGDGVNDAPALAQANIGIVMAPVGSDVAIEASHISLLREDWNLVPQLLQISHRTMRVVRTNLGFTGVYNLIGLTLAAMGLLPPVFAAAAQSIPDLVIMANSSRLLRQ